MQKVDKLLAISFYFLFSLTPIIFFPSTSELFEFNKIVFVYLITVVVAALWVGKSILQRKFIFRRTILDIPLVLFLLSQVISTVFSIDWMTSIFGYYSRFNGGLVSTISYLLLYWAYVSNIDSTKTLKCIKYLIISTFLVSLYGIAEHFGIDKNLWVQDVQSRVFSTLGQPNWLAALLAVVLPLTWVMEAKTSLKGKLKNLIWSKVPYFLSAVFFLTLLFTKSRSGLIAIAVSDFLFAIVTFIKNKKNIRALFTHNLIFIILVLFVGTPWTPSLAGIIRTGWAPSTTSSTNTNETVLETGGTESGEIRKIVWKGAIDIWKHYPLIGSGVETFAYSYFQFRPQEHNLVSEWDYLYNKAHNEYLNYLATTGIIGLTTYLAIIVLSCYILWKLKYKDQKYLNLALLAGYLTILITNFFGFSVVVISLLTFLYPAFAITLAQQEKDTPKQKSARLSPRQIILLAVTSCATAFVLYCLARYWYADYLYSKGKDLNTQKEYSQARITLYKAVKTTPITQPLYLEEISKSASGLAVEMFNNSDLDNAKLFAETAIYEINQAIKISPRNINYVKSRASILISLSNLDTKLLSSVESTIKSAITLAPSDAKLYYNLALTQARLTRTDEAVQTLEKAIELKANYKDARYALGLIYSQRGEKEKAKAQFQYILDKISPDDTKVQQKLLELSK